MAQSLDPAPANVSSAQPTTAPSRSLQWPWLCAIAAVAIAIYAPGLGNLPVFDDSFYTEGALKARFSGPYLWTRLVSYGTFMWIDSLFGEALWIQRIGNLAIHLGVVGALWAFYREVGRSIAPPSPEPGEAAQPYHQSHGLGIAIGYFALNPVAVYAVAYLIQRTILMATLFVVLGLWLVARGFRTRQWWLHALALLCYVLAVASKEHAVLAPLCALPIYVLVARPARKRLAIVAAATLVLVAIAGLILKQRVGIVLGAAFDEFSHVYLAQLAALDASAPQRAWSLSIENQAWLFFEYGFRWFVPVSDWMSISLRPPFPVHWLTFPQVLGIPLYLATIVGACALLLRTRDWRALAGLSLLLPAILFATEFATVWVQDPFVLYRSYLWAIGLPGLVLCFVHGTSTRALVVVATIVGILLAWQATERVLSFSSPETVWADAIRKLPNDPRAVGRWFPYLNRGSYYADHDQFELAIRDFEAASTLGDMGMGSFNAGSMLAAQGKPRQALAMFDRAQKQGYNLYSLPFQRGQAFAVLGRLDEAYHQFTEAMLMTPPSPAYDILRLQRGRVALQTGHSDTAVSDLTAYLQYDAKHDEARYLLALAHLERAQPNEALAVIDAGSETMKRGGPAHYARALAYHRLGRKAEAAREIDEAVRIGPANPMLLQWQARIRAMR